MGQYWRGNVSAELQHHVYVNVNRHEDVFRTYQGMALCKGFLREKVRERGVWGKKKASVDVAYIFMLFTPQWVFAPLNYKCEREHYCVH